MSGLRIAAWGIALATAAALTTGLLQVLAVLPSAQKDWIPLPIYPVLALALFAPAAVGLRIAQQMPRNRIAWILLVGAFLPALQISAEQLVGAAWAMQTERATTYPLLFAWPVAVAFVFPNGRLLSRRWRWVAVAAVVSFAVTLGVGIINPFAFDPPNEGIRNPLFGNDVGEWIDQTGVWIPFVIGLLASVFAGALAAVLRYRRSAGVERLQLQWFLWAAALFPLALGYDTLAGFVLGGGGVVSAARAPTPARVDT